MNKKDNKLGDIIYKQREAKGISTPKLAEAVGLHHSAMARIQLGEIRQPRPGALARIARALDLDPNELLVTAGYVDPRELPTFKGYLNTKYRELPPAAIDELTGHLDYLVNKHLDAAPRSTNTKGGEHEHPQTNTKHRAE